MKAKYVMNNSSDGSTGSNGTSNSDEWDFSLLSATALQEKSSSAMIKQIQDGCKEDPKFCESTEGMIMLYKACSEGLLPVLECFVEDFHIDVNMTIATSRLKETPLHVACQHNQVPIVRYLLEKGGNIAAKQLNGYTPIHIACEKGYFEMVVKLTESLLASGDRQVLEMKQNDEWTGLQLAARSGHVNIFVYLIKNNLADVTAADSNGKTALHFACSNGSNDIVQLLVQHQQDYPNKDNASYITEAAQYNGWNALHFATRYGHADIVQSLIINGNVDVNSKVNDDDLTSLHLACQYGYVDIVQHLLRHDKIKYDAVTKAEGLTPFLLGCKHGHKKVLEELFNKDKKVINARSHDMSSGEHYASMFGHFDIVNWIFPLKYPFAFLETCSIEKTSSCKTPLHFACIAGHIDIAKYLLMEMTAADVIAIDTNGKRALHYAIERNNVALVECFSAIDKSFRQAEEDEESYLQYACKYGHVDIAKYLLEQDLVNVNHAKEREGWTALHAACRNNQLPIVELLVEIGDADVDKVTYEGWTALHLACRKGNLAVAKYLLQNGHAKVDIYANGGMTALHFATANGHIDIVQLLLNEGGADIEAKTNEGLTPLHIASSRGFLGMMKLLLELGASSNVVNKANQIPLEYAKYILKPSPPPAKSSDRTRSQRFGRPKGYYGDMVSITDIAELLIPKNEFSLYQLDTTVEFDFF